MSGATSSFLLKGESSLRSSEVWGGNVKLLDTSSDGLQPNSDGLHLVASSY